MRRVLIMVLLVPYFVLAALAQGRLRVSELQDALTPSRTATDALVALRTCGQMSLLNSSTIQVTEGWVTDHADTERHRNVPTASR